ncbi:lysophospholipid transporter LplT [Methylomonas rapida]|uniref:Lysophospholipid transporter LplT n=1 Tax=Methylomonas rapida TaxID=2963939 RepID=A0ABY7GK51_9GAMM|nr:lysophospholipid transporter LplT [Methylomonas rapida]WAR43843.1 lysophospholipid transporter LplT [Methylomonas rapida]
MSKHIYSLLIAQFLSAFADNAILFTVIALVMQHPEAPGWYVPALQSVFLVAFVLLAPWVGTFADNQAKSRVLIIANLIKAAGAGLLLLKVEPLIAYCIVGVGAALYSPAKYGILPELARHDCLVKANSWIEGSTILAILTGMVVGAKVADYSTSWALLGTIALFLISAATTVLLPSNVSRKEVTGSKVMQFFQEVRSFLSLPRSRFAVLGASLFWAAAACVRVIIVAWAPLVLMSHNASDIANLTLFLALGIIAGSALVPHLIPLEHLRRARIPAYFMALLIMGLGFTDEIWPARIVLFLMGTAGGMFIVPVNAALQELGQQSIGSGGAVAMQNFFQNAAMLLSVGGYTFAASLRVGPIEALLALGALLLLTIFLVVSRLPNNQATTIPE